MQSGKFLALTVTPLGVGTILIKMSQIALSPDFAPLRVAADFGGNRFDITAAT
jgi:hypothetical protein